MTITEPGSSDIFVVAPATSGVEWRPPAMPMVAWDRVGVLVFNFTVWIVVLVWLL
ncbi:MAG: hypothetical protein AAF799_17950 [Myxococcota bacterium]